jgi:hypothetical protein
MPVESEIALGGCEADEHRGVDLGCKLRGRENAGHVEPLAAEPDALTGIDAPDPEPLRCRCAEHDNRQSPQRGQSSATTSVTG